MTVIPRPKCLLTCMWKQTVKMSHKLSHLLTSFIFICLGHTLGAFLSKILLPLTILIIFGPLRSVYLERNRPRTVTEIGEEHKWEKDPDGHCNCLIRLSWECWGIEPLFSEMNESRCLFPSWTILCIKVFVGLCLLFYIYTIMVEKVQIITKP